MGHDPTHFTKAYRAAHHCRDEDMSDEWKSVRNDLCGKCGHKVDDHIYCSDGEPVGDSWYDCQKCKECCDPKDLFAASNKKEAKKRSDKHTIKIVGDWLESEEAIKIGLNIVKSVAAQHGQIVHLGDRDDIRIFFKDMAAKLRAGK